MTRRRISVVIGVAATVFASACAHNEPLSTAQLRERAAVPKCEQPHAGHVVYTGESSELGECLESLRVDDIAELRINSLGGDAAQTLKLAQRLVGRIDLIVVDGVCASSCANYLLAIADRIIVKPNSLVLLHGSIDLDQLAAHLVANRDQMRKEAEGTSEADLTRAIERALAKTREDAMHQTEFEAERLSCRDWLDPNLHFPPDAVPPSIRFKFLVVTAKMATRCFRQTKVERFWEPPAKDRERLTAQGFVLAQR